MTNGRLARAVMLACVVAPSSALAQGITWFPDEFGFSTQSFEDLWPSRGDYDFNDLVLRTHVERVEDVSGDVTRLSYSFNVYALGASQCAAVGLRLHGVPPSAVAVTRVIGEAGSPSGAPWTPAAATVVSDGAGGAVVELSGDVRAELCGEPGFLNTVPGAATVACAPLGVRIDFATPTSVVPPEPGDLFYFRCDDQGHQVHRSIYGPIPSGAFATATARFGTAADASETGAGADRFYVDERGVPFALAFADDTYAIAAESQSIDVVMPDILAFAAGTGGATFWHTPGAGAYAFSGSPPPLPIAVFEFAATEQELCDADPFGIWAEGACDCHLGGASWGWDGATCFDDESGLCADWAGTWANDTCDCPGDLLWSGASCYDGADEQAAACVVGSQAAYGSFYAGGGAWTGTTCDCSARGVGYYWNGFGCTVDPSYGEILPGVPYEAACWDAGGVWQPWAQDIPSFVPQDICDCSAVGAGLYFDGTSCVDQWAAGQVDTCEQTGGFWYQGGCDCAPAGYGFWFDATQGCIDGDVGNPSPEARCLAEGAAWTGTYCDCSVAGGAQTWNGSECVGGAEYFCETYWPAGTGWNALAQTCDCTPYGLYWDSEGWQCYSYESALSNCQAYNGSWVGDDERGTCECPPDAYWDGGTCVWSPLLTGCEAAGGTWYPRAEGNEVLPGQPGACDCPAGQIFDVDAVTCVPYREFECERRFLGSTWTPGVPDGSCDCNGGVQFGDWNGEICVTSYERRACEQYSVGWWDAALGTCQCNNGGTWNTDLLYCQDATGQQNCERAPGVWDYWTGTCGCQGTYEAWDPALQQCVYSPERHGCEEDRRHWYQGGDPERPGLYGCACEAWNERQYGPPDPMDWDWDPARVECVDLSDGKVSCQVDHSGVWSDEPEFCNCASSPEPFSTWNPLVDACVYDPEVEACGDQPPSNYGSWNPAAEACTCWGPDNTARWEWDAQTETGACVGPLMEACQADPIAWWNEYGRTCECGNAPGAGWAYDPETEVGSCTNPEYDDCIAEPGGTWGGAIGSLTCTCADGESWTWQSHGQGEGFGVCALTWDELYCLDVTYSQPPGTWTPTGGPYGTGYCDCDAATTSRRFNSWSGCGYLADATVAACDQDPDGTWMYEWDSCDCLADGIGAYFDGTECTTPVEDSCEGGGGTWDEGAEWCECAPGHSWNPGSYVCESQESVTCDADPIGVWNVSSCYCGANGSWAWDGASSWSCTNTEYDACTDPAATDRVWDEFSASCVCNAGAPMWFYDTASLQGSCTWSGSWEEHSCNLDPSGEWDPALNFCACDETQAQRWNGAACEPGHTEVQHCADDPGGSWDYQYNTCDCAAAALASSWLDPYCVPYECDAAAGHTWDGSTCFCSGGSTWDGGMCVLQ